MLVLLGVFTTAAVSASAEPLPAYGGLLDFPTIHGPSDPEEYSWQVDLHEGQELKAIDDQRAEVYFEDGTASMSIDAESARDADGSAVPTSLRVSEGDVVTLTVDHRDGDPAAGGAPFDYPINAGPSFEVGFSSVIFIGPKDEAELQRERERIAMEEREAAERGAGRSCVVPRLKGQPLKVDRRKLREAGCRLGDVRGARSKSARVVRQYARPGTVLGLDADVGVKLG